MRISAILRENQQPETLVVMDREKVGNLASRQTFMFHQG